MLLQINSQNIGYCQLGQGIMNHCHDRDSDFTRLWSSLSLRCSTWAVIKPLPTQLTRSTVAAGRRHGRYGRLASLHYIIYWFVYYIIFRSLSTNHGGTNSLSGNSWVWYIMMVKSDKARFDLIRLSPTIIWHCVILPNFLIWASQGKYLNMMWNYYWRKSIYINEILISISSTNLDAVPVSSVTDANELALKLLSTSTSTSTTPSTTTVPIPCNDEETNLTK